MTQKFEALTRFLLDADSVHDVLMRVLVAAQQLIPRAELVSVTLMSEQDTYSTPAETHPHASALDGLQYRLGEGPCVDAANMDGAGSAASDNLAGGDPWPRFGPPAAEFGYNTVLATALLPSAQPHRVSGALNMYGTQPFTSSDRDLALLLSTHASLALEATAAVTRAELQKAQLLTAIATRDVIGKPKAS